MRRILQLLCLLVTVLAAMSLFAQSKNPADYPLRLHIYTNEGVTFYHNRYPDESRGDGRANLFENGEVRGLDFRFDCSDKIKPSFQFETYPAKWKKQNQKLIVLFPVIGKTNQYFTCTLDTQLKDYAYFVRNGRLASEPAEQFKAWMVAREYDPEHGKNEPKMAAEPQVVYSRLYEARQALTGLNKDTDKAKKLLLEIAQGKDDTTAETMVWTDIYLGYIEDRAKNRQDAVGWYQKAVTVDGATPAAVKLAQFGLKQPLVWIRHLDAPPEKSGGN